MVLKPGTAAKNIRLITSVGVGSGSPLSQLRLGAALLNPDLGHTALGTRAGPVVTSHRSKGAVQAPANCVEVGEALAFLPMATAATVEAGSCATQKALEGVGMLCPLSQNGGTRCCVMH